MSAYLRMIAIDGYVVRLELPELQEMISVAALQQPESARQARQ